MITINIRKIVAYTLMSASFIACDMEVVPPSEIASENFWKTEKDAWYGLNACYSQMPAIDIFDEMTTDNAHSHKPWEGPFELIQQNGISSEYNQGYSFGGIRIYNNFLSKVDGCEIDESLRDRMKAEARFFRASDYLNLTMKFGKVPLITEVLAYNAPNVPRDSEETIRGFILSELTQIAEILPDSYSGGYMNETGRITRAAALTLKARAALYFGDFKTAEEASGKVISEGHHSLFRITSLNAAQLQEAEEMNIYIDFEAKGINKDKFMKGMFSYESLWHNANASPSNPEYILTHEYMADDNHYDWSRYIYIRPSQLVQGYSSFEPMQDLVDAYWDIDGKTIRNSIPMATRQANFAEITSVVTNWVEEQKKSYIDLVPTMDLTNYEYMDEFRNRDSRLYASILFPFKGWHETDAGTFYYRWNPEKAGFDGNESWTGYSYRKMVALQPYDSWANIEDYPTIRYAEVLLTYAEAKIQTTGWDTEVQKVLNDLRDRCGMPNVPTTMSSKEEALNFVRNERRIELAGEGQRYEDIRRYGSAYCAKAMNGASYAPNGYTVVTKSWNDRLMLMPIPQSAMDLNPLLTNDQNAGY